MARCVGQLLGDGRGGSLRSLYEPHHIYKAIHALSGVGPYTGLVIGQNGVTKDNEDGKKDIA